MDGSERFEQLIAFINSQLSKPIEEEHAADGSILFTGGDPSEVIVHLTDETVTVAEFAGDWDEDAFSITPRIVGELYWHTLPETALMNALSALIKGAREVRLSKYRMCAECGDILPPEYFGTNDVCARCADDPSRLVH